jgi:alpha-L-fucosidase
VDFTHKQIMELVTEYGRIDILWLDAGWVCPQAGQDIRLGEVVEKARQHQPWLLVVDRTVGGPYENYVTPEQTIPKRPLLIPWESCITMGTSFSFAYEDRYKSLRELVAILVEVVAKGGNLALNVGPQPDGRFPNGAVRCMQELGGWLQTYGEAIYGTRPVEPYFTGEWGFTKKGRVVYAIQLPAEHTCCDDTELLIPFRGKVERVDRVAGEENLEFTQSDAGIHVSITGEEGNPVARVFRLQGSL